jgi:hypothetical protein
VKCGRKEEGGEGRRRTVATGRGVFGPACMEEKEGESVMGRDEEGGKTGRRRTVHRRSVDDLWLELLPIRRLSLRSRQKREESDRKLVRSDSTSAVSSEKKEGRWKERECTC